MAWLVFGICTAIGLMLLMRWLSLTPANQAKRSLAWTIAAIIVVAAIFLALTGRLAWAGAAISALIPWGMRAIRLHGLWREAKRTFGNAESYSQQSPPRPPGQKRMSPEEALAVLGLKPGASKDEIQTAYKRLMQKVHPDAGGSSALAAQINEARDILTGKR
jgi:hypothetical protein